ncbi:YigZ family protein, partial [bacterium]|nr:YigZ family protein [bacterium]
ERLAAVRRAHHAATHHCWARRLGGHGPVSDRYDDDGEPSGTAGAPMLAVLSGEDLRDTLVVVTRYYGGTKLGTGGLARTYADSVRAALEATPRRIVWHETTVRVECTYEDMGAVEAVLAREGSRIRRVDRDFTGSPVFRVAVLRSFAPRLVDLLREATAGRARTS